MQDGKWRSEFCYVAGNLSFRIIISSHGDTEALREEEIGNRKSKTGREKSHAEPQRHEEKDKAEACEAPRGRFISAQGAALGTNGNHTQALKGRSINVDRGMVCRSEMINRRSEFCYVAGNLSFRMSSHWAVLSAFPKMRLRFSFSPCLCGSVREGIIPLRKKYLQTTNNQRPPRFRIEVSKKNVMFRGIWLIPIGESKLTHYTCAKAR